MDQLIPLVCVGDRENLEVGHAASFFHKGAIDNSSNPVLLLMSRDNDHLKRHVLEYAAQTVGEALVCVNGRDDDADIRGMVFAFLRQRQREFTPALSVVFRRSMFAEVPDAGPETVSMTVGYAWLTNTYTKAARTIGAKTDEDPTLPSITAI